MVKLEPHNFPESKINISVGKQTTYAATKRFDEVNRELEGLLIALAF